MNRRRIYITKEKEKNLSFTSIYRDPFDPLKLAKDTELIVSRGNLRKYSHFGWTRNYGKGVATGYACGCCLRCVFCWSTQSRDSPEKWGKFYSPSQVVANLTEIARRISVKKARISGAEPTLGKQHLLEVLELIEGTDIERFILETNGILLGADYDYVAKLSEFSKVHLRISLKAGTADDFTRKTGAESYAFNLPFQAIRNIRELGIDYSVAAMSADPRLMTPIERICLIKYLAEIDPALVLKLEEEVVYAFPDTIKRMKAVGYDLGMSGVHKWFPRFVYVPVQSLQKKKFSLYLTIKNIRELLAGI